MKYYQKKILFVIVLPLIVVAQSPVHFWIDKEIDNTKGAVLFTVSTTGFTAAKAFGCEVLFDSLTLTQEVLGKISITANYISLSKIRYKNHSIRFFVLSKKASPLLALPYGKMITITVPLDIAFASHASMRSWKTGLIDESFHPIPVTFSPVLSHSDQIEANEESGASNIYPNPFKGSFTIRTAQRGAERLDYTLYDILGRSIQSRNIVMPMSDEKISFGDIRISPGIYFLRLKITNRSGVSSFYLHKLVKVQ